jgi:hypothetical protein
MATLLAHIKAKPGMESRIEAMAKALYASTHDHETHVVRYEYWRGTDERMYYTLLSFDDYVGFIEHQASPHHVDFTRDFADMVESFRLEWLDPIQGASPLVQTAPEPLPPDANDLMKAYAERQPAEIADWWLPFR